MCCYPIITYENSLYDVEVKIRLVSVRAKMSVPINRPQKSPLVEIMNVAPFTIIKHIDIIAKANFFLFRIIMPPVKANAETKIPNAPSPR